MENKFTDEEDYKNILKVIQNNKDFINKFLLLFITTVMTLISFGAGKFIEHKNSIFLDITFLGLFGLVIPFMLIAIGLVKQLKNNEQKQKDLKYKLKKA